MISSLYKDEYSVGYARLIYKVTGIEDIYYDFNNNVYKAIVDGINMIYNPTTCSWEIFKLPHDPEYLTNSLDVQYY